MATLHDVDRLLIEALEMDLEKYRDLAERRGAMLVELEKAKDDHNSLYMLIDSDQFATLLPQTKET